jgi:predicted acyltransferase
MQEKSQQKSARLLSLDALRGFDMLWITGGQKIVYALATMTGWPFFEWLNKQMKHVEWNGFTFYDMIFPLFLFLAGVSMPYSFSKRVENGASKKSIYLHALKRMILLVILGMLYNGVFTSDIENMRFASVLGRIGMAWFFAAMIFLNSSFRGQIIWLVSILTGYCLLMLYVPVPGYGAGVLTPEGNLSGYIDRLLLPGKLYMDNIMEAEGILSTLPAIATALMGVLAGQFLKIDDQKINRIKKSVWIFTAGVMSIGAGLLWDLMFPINKILWTSSFVLFSGGISLMLLGVFYLIIDTLGYKKWTYFFVVIGLNSITIYLVQHKFIDFNKVREFVFGALIHVTPVSIQPLVSAVLYVFCVWLFLFFLYKNKIFLKV